MALTIIAPLIMEDSARFCLRRLKNLKRKTKLLNCGLKRWKKIKMRLKFYSEKKRQKPKLKIPKSFQGILWSANIKNLDLERDKGYIIHQVLM